MNRYKAIQTLSLESNATFDDAKYRYRKLALELHPDKNKKERNDNKFKKITEAYHYLKKQNKMNNSKLINEKTADQEKSSMNTTKQAHWKTHSSDTQPTEDWTSHTNNFEMDEEFWTLYEKSFWEDYEQNVFQKPKNNFEKMFWEDPEKNMEQMFKNRLENRKKFDHNLKIQVDKSLCIACCSCETIAPDVFVIDKISAVNPKSKVHNQHGAHKGKIMDAAKTCPTKAILVHEKDSKKKIYPL